MNQSPALRRSWLLVPIATVLAVGCGPHSGGDVPDASSGSGGSPGTGGAGTGGAATGGMKSGASGGVTGSSSGGVIGTGGAPSTGGVIGTGGAVTQTGGMVGSGGVSPTTGTGGETATGGAASGGVGAPGGNAAGGGGSKGTGGAGGAGAGAKGGSIGNTGSGGGIPSNCGLSTPVSYKKDVEPILSASCGKNSGGGCHVVDNSSTMGAACPDGTKTCGFDHAYDWITAGSHASSCPGTPNPKRFEVVLDVMRMANPSTCSKSRFMPPPPATPMTACQIAAFQAWLAETPTAPQLHRTDDSSPTTPYAMPPYN